VEAKAVMQTMVLQVLVVQAAVVVATDKAVHQVLLDKAIMVATLVI
jgi:hypothetical protein